jgi:predicted nucleotidyltransferase component of viral defense system
MTLNIDRHKTVLLSILKNIYTDNSIGPILGFKGGTAAFLFYGLERFSVDLDFDLLDPEEGQHVFERLERILSAHGTIKIKRQKHFTIFFEVSYAEGERNIKVEVNNRAFGSRYQVANYFGISMKVMLKEDMFGHKIVAMYERLGKTNRDIYDVWYFLNKHWTINKVIVEKRTGMTFKEFLAACIGKIEKLADRTILSGMGELLDAKQKAWAKAKLKTEILFYLKVIALA